MMNVKESSTGNKETGTPGIPTKVGSLRVNAGSVESVEIISS
jgi:hypothetical protein